MQAKAINQLNVHFLPFFARFWGQIVRLFFMRALFFLPYKKIQEIV